MLNMDIDKKMLNMDSKRLCLGKIQLELERFYNFKTLKPKSNYNLLNKHIFLNEKTSTTL